MGQRFIMTESEKNRIRGLYEAGGSETITGADLDTFTKNIRNQTVNKQIDTRPGSISINLDTKTLTYKTDPNINPVTRLSLAYSDGTNPKCESCDAIKRQNDGSPGKYLAKEIANGQFQNGTRQFMLFAMIPPGSAAI